jgi:hypothetical protein
MRRVILCASVILASIFPGMRADAAEIQVGTCTRPEKGTDGNSRSDCDIRLVGEISSGDAQKLGQLLRSPLKEGQAFQSLKLDSPGGEVREAIRIAQIVRQALLETINWSDKKGGNSQCLSACFLVWVAGSHRHQLGESTNHGTVGIGLHRPYFAKEFYSANAASVADAHQSLNEYVRNFLRREDVPEDLINLMLSRSSREIYWLHENGEPFRLSGDAGWFQEMRIAECRYDPTVDEKLNQDIEGERIKRRRQGLPEWPSNPAPKMKAWIDWEIRQQQCQHDLRLRAQSTFRK